MLFSLGAAIEQHTTHSVNVKAVGPVVVVVFLTQVQKSGYIVIYVTEAVFAFTLYVCVSSKTFC